MVHGHPPILWAVELPKGSGRWHALDSLVVADALKDSGYTVRAYLSLLDLMESTGDQEIIRAAADHAPHRLSPPKAQQAIRGFLLKVTRMTPGA
jgi:hypothetical protein